MISSEYGWTDETILDLTIARIRQISAAITERKLSEHKVQRSLLAWQTRTICQYIAAANQSMEGGENHLLNAASEITLDSKPKSDSEEKSDDSSSERPIKYADTSKLALFARGLMAGGPVPA